MHRVAVQVFEVKDLPPRLHLVCKCTDEVVDVYVTPGLSLLIDDFASSFSSEEQEPVPMLVPFSSKTVLEVIGLVQEGSFARGDEDILSCIDFFQIEEKTLDECRWRLLDWRDYHIQYNSHLGEIGEIVPELVGDLSFPMSYDSPSADPWEEIRGRRAVVTLHNKFFRQKRWDILVSDTYRNETLLYRFVAAPHTLQLKDLPLLSIQELTQTQARNLHKYIKNMEKHMTKLLLSIIKERPLEEVFAFITWATSPNGWTRRTYVKANGAISMDAVAICLSGRYSYRTDTLRAIHIIAKSLRSKGYNESIVWPGAALTWTDLCSTLKRHKKAQK